MPRYDYHCDENGLTIEVAHAAGLELATWGELCYAAQQDLGDTDPFAAVRKVFTPPNVSVPAGNSQLKNAGFTKLVKRDAGVYENVTATGNEKRYMTADDPDSIPDLKKKIGD